MRGPGSAQAPCPAAAVEWRQRWPARAPATRCQLALGVVRSSAYTTPSAAMSSIACRGFEAGGRSEGARWDPAAFLRGGQAGARHCKPQDAGDSSAPRRGGPHLSSDAADGSVRGGDAVDYVEQLEAPGGRVAERPQARMRAPTTRRRRRAGKARQGMDTGMAAAAAASAEGRCWQQRAVRERTRRVCGTPRASAPAAQPGSAQPAPRPAAQPAPCARMRGRGRAPTVTGGWVAADAHGPCSPCSLLASHRIVLSRMQPFRCACSSTFGSAWQKASCSGVYGSAAAAAAPAMADCRRGRRWRHGGGDGGRRERLEVQHSPQARSTDVNDMMLLT